MILTETAVAKINKPKCRIALAGKLDFTEGWIISLIKENKDNGPLTTYAAIEVITEFTGLKLKEILIEDVKTAKVA